MSLVEALSFKDVHDVEWQQEALPKVEGHVGGQLGTGPNIIMTEFIAHTYLSPDVFSIPYSPKEIFHKKNYPHVTEERSKEIFIVL